MSELIKSKGGTMAFQPKLFIGVGQLGCFFTLRETFLHYVPGRGPYGNAVVNGVYQGSVEVRSFHHYNLSQDPDEAFAKATEAAAKMGMVLSTTRASLQDELNEIKRASAEQREESERLQRERNERWEAERAAQAARWAMEEADLLAAGRIPFGRDAGEHFSDIDPGYLGWMVFKREQFEEGSILRRTADLIATEYRHLLLPEPTNQNYIGEVGKRIEFEATVVRDYAMHGDWGTTHLVTLVTNDGACVLAKGGWTQVIGAKVRVKATVKRLDEYKGQNQTVVNRVKELA